MNKSNREPSENPAINQFRDVPPAHTQPIGPLRVLYLRWRWLRRRRADIGRAGVALCGKFPISQVPLLKDDQLAVAPITAAVASAATLPVRRINCLHARHVGTKAWSKGTSGAHTQPPERHMTACVGQSRVRRLTDLPSPRGLPLVGNALQIDPKRLHLILEEWSKVFGETYTISLGPKKVFVSSNPELLQIALRERPERYRRFSPLESLIREMRWHGVFSTEGAAWRPQRLLVVQALAATNFRGFFPTLRAITRRLRRKWQRAADSGEIVEMTQDLVRYTLDVTTALLFGEDPNTIERSDSLIQDHLAQVLPMLNARMNAPFPLWRYLRLPKDRRLDRSIEIVRGYIHALIEGARRRMRDEPSELPRNLLEALLTEASEPRSGIDDELIVANVMTLLLAGEDTTAHTLAWTMLFLGSQPQLQLRLQTASVEALGDARVCPAFEDLKKLDLFEAAAHESMRMKPTIPMNFLEPVTDVVLGDVEVPAGTPLFFLLRPSMLNGKHFGKPEQFLPERWEAGHAGVEPHDARAYIQFGAGPRFCPGRHLAGMELRLVLSMMLRNFSMQLACDEGAVKEVMGFTMMPSTMPVRLTAIVGR